MSALIHNKKALEVSHQFYKKSCVVWVEGDDDIIFWDNIFKNNGINDIQINKANGKPNLQKYIEQIINNDAKIIVACDCDYDEISCKLAFHDRIIHTYGYSIENSMYCPKIIERNIKKLSRTQGDYVMEIKEWYKHIYEELELLIIYDFAKEFYGKSISVMGDNCKKFLVSDNSSNFSKEKINNKIQQIKASFNIEEFDFSKKQISEYKKEKQYIIKGHFLTEIIRNKIKRICLSNGKDKVSITNEHLFCVTSDGCINCVPKCKDKQFLENKINRAIKSVKKIS